MTEHVHEWKLTVGHSNCKACHYSSIEGVACCEICNESIGPTEIERRLNATERLSAEDARQGTEFLSRVRNSRGYGFANALRAYADILEGKDD